MEKLLIHISTQQKGTFIKEYYVTGKGYTTQIRLKDGRIYFAPSIEFTEVK